MTITEVSRDYCRRLAVLVLISLQSLSSMGGLGEYAFSRRLLLGILGLEGFLPGGGVAIKVSKARYGEGTADLVFFLNSV